MPLTDSIEKPLAAEHTAGPIAVFSNSYARLPEHFFAQLSPTPLAKPRLIKFNESLAAELGVDTRGLAPDEVAAIFAGNVIVPGAEPIAMAYAAHQFGNFVPQLGDGRAILLGEVVNRNGERRDIQLKGAGRTPFSRRGDGRAALGPVLREYLVSEAMHALGVPTTRALRRSQPENLFSATASCLGPYSPGSHRVTSGSGPSNISPRAETWKPLNASPTT
jgi:uncharacterized protein YdiU (UPF0061 family)